MRIVLFTLLFLSASLFAQESVELTEAQSAQLELADQRIVTVMKELERLEALFQKAQSDLRLLRQSASETFAKVCKAHDIDPEKYGVEGSDYSKLVPRGER